MKSFLMVTAMASFVLYIAGAWPGVKCVFDDEDEKQRKERKKVMIMGVMGFVALFVVYISELISMR